MPARCFWDLQVEMSYVSCALRAATPRCLPAPWRSPRPFSSATGPTAKKSVPYQKTLKEEGSGTGEPSRPLPPSAEVVVVGGGSLGCQTTYHLAKQGVTSVVLLERDRLTSGTTWHTAGEAVGTARVLPGVGAAGTGMHTTWDVPLPMERIRRAGWLWMCRRVLALNGENFRVSVFPFGITFC